MSRDEFNALMDTARQRIAQRVKEDPEHGPDFQEETVKERLGYLIQDYNRVLEMVGEEGAIDDLRLAVERI